MSQLLSKEWWIAAGTRAIKTVAQTAIAVIGAAMFMNEVDWRAVASAALLAGILSLLTSIAGLPELKARQQIASLQNELQAATAPEKRQPKAKAKKEDAE